MYFLSEKGIENNGAIASINEDLVLIKHKLEIEDKNIIILENQVAYTTVRNLLFGNISGECKLLFMDDTLVSISFSPNMERYISELKQVTRQGLYSCVYKAYRELNEHASKLNMICVESGEKRTIYKTKNIKISVVIDNSNESVCIKQEAINE